MDVAKLTQKKVLQILENGVRFGKWVLLENIGEVGEHPLGEQRKEKCLRTKTEHEGQERYHVRTDGRLHQSETPSLPLNPAHVSKTALASF